MTTQIVEKERSSNPVFREKDSLVEVLAETHAVSHPNTETEATVAKAKVFKSQLMRATRNRLLLSIPLSVITMLCCFMGQKWLSQANISWLQEAGIKDYAFVIVLILACYSVGRLEKLLRSFIGEQHFEC